jgi:hypothetical protein
MKHSRSLRSCLALLILAPLASAQETSPLSQIPAQSPIVVHVRGFERTKGRLVTLINNALPDLGKRVQESIEDTIKGELGERQFKGLAPFGPVFAVFTQLPEAGEEKPPVALVLRVTDSKAFRNGFFTEQERKTLRKDQDGYEVLKFKDEDTYVLERPGYVIFSPRKDVMASFRGKQDKGLDAVLDGASAKRLLETDAAVYVDLAAVHRVYGQTVRDAGQFLDIILQQGAAAGDKEQVEMVKAIVDGALQGFEDSRGLVITVDFRPDGLALHAQVTFKTDTKTNEVLKALTPGELKEIETLPPGQMTYSAVRAEPALVKTFHPFLLGVMVDPASKQGAAVQKAVDLLTEAGPQGMLQTVNLQQHGIGVSRYKDPAKAVQAQLQLFQTISNIESYNQLKLKKATIKPDDQKHRGFTLHHADLVWDFEKMLDAAIGGGKEFEEAMRKMIGDGVKIWFGTDGKTVVQVSAKDWAAAQKTLDDYLDGKKRIGDDAAFQEARKQLPGQTNVLMLYNVPELMDSIRTMIGTMFRATGQGEIKLDPAKERPKPTFLGLAITLKAEHASLDVWIPAATAREVQKLIEPFLQVFGGPIG